MLLMWHCTDGFLLLLPPSPPSKPFFQESHLPLQAKQLPKLSFPWDTSTLALVCILSLILNCTHTIPSRDKSTGQKELFLFFYHKKSDRFCINFSSIPDTCVQHASQSSISKPMPSWSASLSFLKNISNVRPESTYGKWILGWLPP